MKLIFSKSASFDIDTITDYGEKNWGYAQSDKYIDGLWALFQLMLEHPEMGKVYISDTKHSYRFIAYGSHSVFWTHQKSYLTIAAIMGQNQLPDNYL